MDAWSSAVSSRLTNKQFSILIDSLFILTFVDVKLINNTKGSTTAVESRLNRSCSSLRKLLFYKKPTTAQTLKVLWNIERLWREIGPFRSITLECAKTLTFLTSNASRIIHLSDVDYSRLVRFLVDLLNKELYFTSNSSDGSSTGSNLLAENDKIAYEVIESIHNTISSPSLPSPRLCLFANSQSLLLSVVECISNYLNHFKKASLSTLLVVKIINFIVLNFTLENVKVVHRLTIKLLNLIPDFQLYNYPSLKDQILVFILLASDLVYPFVHLPKPIQGVEYDKLEELNKLQILFERLLDFADSQMISVKDHQFNLRFSVINFFDNQLRYPTMVHWFKLDHIFLDYRASKRQSFLSDQRAWLSRIMISKYIVTYYKIKQDIEQLSNENASDAPILKRRKVSYGYTYSEASQFYQKLSFIETINSSATLLEFLSALVKSRDDSRMALGCQIFIFSLSIGQFSYEVKNENFIQQQQLVSFLKLVLANLDNEYLTNWGLLALKIMLDHIKANNLKYQLFFEFSEIIQILKAGLQMVKIAELSSVACSVVISALNLFDATDSAERLNLLNDQSLNQLVFSIIDLSEINGPSNLSNHSFLFWFKINQIFGSSREIRYQFGERLIIWLLSKLEKLPLALTKDNFLAVDKAILWATGSGSIRISKDELYGADGASLSISNYDRLFAEYFILWNSTKQFRSKLFFQDMFLGDKVPEVQNINVSPISTSSNINNLLENLFTNLFINLDSFANNGNGGFITSPDESTALFAYCLKFVNLFLLADGNSFLGSYKENLKFKCFSTIERVLFNNSSKTFFKILHLLNLYAGIDKNHDKHEEKLMFLAEHISFEKLVEKANFIDAEKHIPQLEDTSRESSVTRDYSPFSNGNIGNDEEFSSVRKVGDMNEKANKQKLLNLTLIESYGRNLISEQLLQYLIMYGKHQSLTPVRNEELILQITQYLKSCNTSQFLDCCLLLDKYLSGISLDLADPELVVELVRLIAEKVLSSPDLTVNEYAISFICRVTATLSATCFETKLKDLLLDFLDIHGFIIGLDDLNSMNTMNALVEFQSFLLHTTPAFLLKNHNADFAILTNISSETLIPKLTRPLTECSNALKLNLADAYLSYMKHLAPEKVSKFYKKIFITFDTPQQNSECFFTFSYFLVTMSKGSYISMVSCLFNLIEFLEFEHAAKYISMCLKIVSREFNFSNNLQLFSIFKFELLNFWYQLGNLFDEFPYAIFEYTDKDQFILHNYQILVSYALSHRIESLHGIEAHEAILDKVAQAQGKNRKDLIYELIPLIVALAFTKNGIRNDVFQLLSRTFKKDSIIAAWLPHIVLEALKRTDFSQEDSLTIFARIEPIGIEYNANAERQLPQPTAAVTEKPLAKVEAPVLAISPKTSKFLINTLLSNYYKGSDFWEVKVCFYIYRSIFALIEESPSTRQKLLNIRKLNAMMIITPVACFSHYSLLEMTVTKLLIYAADSELSVETSELITLALNLSKLVGKQSFLCLAYHIGTLLIELTVKGKPVNSTLKHWILDFFDSIRSSSSHDQAFVMDIMLDILRGFKCELTTKDIESIYKTYIIQPDYIKWVEKFVPLIFECQQSLRDISYFYVPSKSIAKFLFKLQNTADLPESFLVWKARYLGNFYSRTGISFDIPKPRKDLIYVQKVFQKERVSYIISLVLRELRILLRDLVTYHRKLVVESTVGALLKIHNEDHMPLDSVCDFASLFGEYRSYIIPVDITILQALYPALGKYKNLDLAAFAANNEQIFLLSEFDVYCTEFLLALVTELAPCYTYLKPFAILAATVPEFSKKILSNLIIFYLDANSNSGAKLINNIISSYISFDEDKQHIESMEFFVDLCLRLRIGTKYESKKFMVAFDNRYSEQLFVLASKLEWWKVALMFYEAFVGDFNNFESLLDPAKARKLLHEAYTSIDEHDLKYSLPVVPSIQYAIDLMNEEDQGVSWRKVMFNSAIFDASFNSNNNSSINVNNNISMDRKSMVNSMFSTGLIGISSLVNDYFASKEKSGNMESANECYQWAWRLNLWDLPVAEENPSYNQVIYKTLKLLGSSTTGNSKSVLEKSFFDGIKLENHHQFNEKLFNNRWDNVSSQLLSALWNVESLLNLNESNLKALYQTQWDYVSWFEAKDSNEYDDILSVREVTLKLIIDALLNLSPSYSFSSSSLAQPPSTSTFPLVNGTEPFRISASSANLLRVYELQNYGTLARLRKDYQKSINSIMKIKQIAESVHFENENHSKVVNIIQQIESANTLWSQQESSISILMLKDLREKVQSIDYLQIPTQQTLVDKSLIDALLVERLYQSKQETPSNITDTYLKPYAAEFKFEPCAEKSNEIKLYHTFAWFCDDQLRVSSFDEDIQRYEKIIASRNKDLKETSRIPGIEAKKYAYKLKKQLLTDTSQLKLFISTKNSFIDYAVYFYLKSIVSSDEFTDSDVDCFCALWLKYSGRKQVNDIVRGFIENNTLAYYKILTWIPQLASRLSTERSEFQTLLRAVLYVASMHHPYHTLYILKNLKLQSDLNSNPDAAMKSRSTAANDLWEQMKQKNPTLQTKYLDPVDLFCDESVKLANYEISNGQKQIMIQNLNMGAFWIDKLPTLKVIIPTQEVPIRKDGKYSELAVIETIAPTIDISSSGISRPKIMYARQTDGISRKILLKGNTDDLRQDAIMEQVFEQVNKLLAKDKETKKRGLKFRTYKVVPLGPQAGLIEFVLNSIPLIDVVYPLHSKHDSISHSQASKKMQSWENLSAQERISNFKVRLCNDIKPVLREFFFRNFLNPYDWFERRLLYSHGTAVCSMVGHVLGLGDRHCNNILLDKQTGEPIHIDLGVAFDQGKLLTIPETVPFRLTRDIVDGLGVSGVEGIFRKSCEHVFRVLREHKEQIGGILEILKWDPLYMWTISPLRRKRLQDQSENNTNLHNHLVEDEGFEASRAVATVQQKLVAHGLSVEAAVRQLIQEASSLDNLALLFRGWAPFF